MGWSIFSYITRPFVFFCEVIVSLLVVCLLVINLPELFIYEGNHLLLYMI